MKLRIKDKLPFSVKSFTDGLFKELIIFFAGFVFANGVIFDSVAPFGISVAANGNIFGLMGVILGYINCRVDTARYIIAAIVAFLVKKTITKFFNNDKVTGKVLSCLWGVAAAGIYGIFASENSVRTNILFVLGGVLSACGAYFLHCSEIFLKDRTKGGQELRLFSLLFCWAVLFIGLTKMGSITGTSAISLSVCILCILIKHGGTVIAAAGSTTLALSLCLYNIKLLPLAAVLVLGTLIGGLLKYVSVFAVVMGFALSNALVFIYAKGGYNLYAVLIAVVFSFIILWVMPEKTEKYFASILIKDKPSVFKKGKKQKFSAKDILQKRMTKGVESENIERICRRCKKKMSCWIGDYDKTVHSLLTMQANCQTPDYEVDKEFEKACPNTEILLRNLRGDLPISDKGLTIDVVRSSRNKFGQIECGDSNACFSLEDNKYCICIADGMGSGEGASEQSKRVSSLIKLMLKRGIDKKDAMDLVNSAILKDKGENILSLDLLLVDLNTGYADMIKADACPTYICRKGNVYSVGTPSMPLGIDCEDRFCSSCLLRGEDIVIMVSDGLCGEDGEFCMNTLKSNEAWKLTSLEIANILVDSAVDEGLADEDDITVIVAKIREL